MEYRVAYAFYNLNHSFKNIMHLPKCNTKLLQTITIIF